MEFSIYLKHYQQRVNAHLSRYFTHAKENRLLDAMRYVVENGGKRLRPLLVYISGELFGAQTDALDATACAVELIHTYSLIHDDLPAMDNDALRRGKPTCHIAYDEATAILAGDALHSLAIEVLAAANTYLSSDSQLKMLHCLAKASGAEGMAGGQMVDLQAVNTSLSEEEIERMYHLKTGALITTSVELGALASGQCAENELMLLKAFANDMGFAFQIHDDILDISTSTDVLGKPQHSDANLKKPTYPLLLGMSAAKNKTQELYERALTHLSKLHLPTKRLEEMAHYMIARPH